MIPPTLIKPKPATNARKFTMRISVHWMQVRANSAIYAKHNMNLANVQTNPTRDLPWERLAKTVMDKNSAEINAVIDIIALLVVNCTQEKNVRRLGKRTTGALSAALTIQKQENVTMPA